MLMGRRSDRCRRSLRGLLAGMRWEEPVDNAAFLQVVRGHLNLHFVTGENTHAVDPHAPCQMTEQNVVFRLFTGHTDFECGIGICFFHNAE